MMKRRAVFVAGILMLGMASNARAQKMGAGDALVDVLFGPQGQGALGLDVVAGIGVVLPSEAATFPLASSSGGFTWTFDPKLGVQTRRSQSFGPMFAERPFTNGKQRFNVGVAFQHTAYDSLAGQPLSGLRTVLRPDQPQPFSFERTYDSNLSFKTDRTIISASYGVTDHIDVGVLVPLEHTTAKGTSNVTLSELNVPAGVCVDVTRPNGEAVPNAACRAASAGPGTVAIPVGLCARTSDGDFLCPFSESNVTGTSSGIGDVIIRGKVSLKSMPMFDLAAGIDLRLPTGDEDQLLGIGTTQTKVTVMGSTTRGRVSPHFNVGYAFSPGRGIPFDAAGNLDFDALAAEDFELGAFQSDELNYTVGVDVALHQMITVMGDVIGRSLRDSAKFDFVTSGASSFFTVSPATLNLILGTVGTKVRIGKDFLLTASVVFPLNSAGIKPRVTPVVGFERAF